MKRMLKLNYETLELEEIQVPEITLDELQKGVGINGEKVWVERAYVNEFFDKAKVDVFLDEEGKLKSDLLPSSVLIDRNGSIMDVYFGNLLFVGNNTRGGSVGLTDKQIEKVKAWTSSKREIIMRRQSDGEVLRKTVVILLHF